MQVMAVAAGCRLEQHIPETQAVINYEAKTGKTIVHEHPSIKPWINEAAQKLPRGWFTAKLRERMLAPGHVVEVTPGSALYRITRLPRFRTTALHHQGLTDAIRAAASHKNDVSANAQGAASRILASCTRPVEPDRFDRWTNHHLSLDGVRPNCWNPQAGAESELPDLDQPFVLLT
jgi:hypothetical protein